MIRKPAAIAALMVSALATTLFALDTSKLKPTGYVNDFAHALTPAGKQQLEAYCAELEQATGAQMAIVLVDTLDDEPIDDAANRLYREWGIGKKGKDEGILLMLAVRDHKNRVEVGYGLEPVITDGYAGSVLRGIRPILRQGNYGGALLAAAQEFGQRIAADKGVALDGVRPVQREPVAQGGDLPWPLLLFGFFFVMWLIGRVSGGGRGGGGGAGGFLTGMILGNMMGRRGGWGGGGFGGYSGGGGGFGGFGGGDSGGGGASGGW